MPTPHQQGPSANGASHANLFVEADPDHEAFESRRSQRLATTSTAARARGGRGLVIPVDTPRAAAVGNSDAARFTRPNGRIARLPTVARKSMRRVDVRAGELLRRVAARPYASLVGLALLGAVLLALSWLGLALRDAASGRHVAERRQITATTALRRDQARIDELIVQLGRAERTDLRLQRASTAAATAWRIRAQSAERQLTLVHRRPH